MSLLDLYAKDLDAGIDQMLRNPGPPPEVDFKMWSFLSAGAKGAPRGLWEYAGDAADALSGLSKIGEGDRSTWSPEKQKLAKDRTAALTKMGPTNRRKAAEFAPDPETSHQADVVINRIGADVTKAVSAYKALGLVQGALVFGASQGNQTYNDLIAKGVDQETAMKVAGVTGVVNAAGVVVPFGGATIPKTAALVVGSGPGLYMAQEKLSKDILQRANYGKEAAQHDPLDPLGLAISTVLPGVFGAVHARGLYKRSLEATVKHIESGGRRYGPDGQLLTSSAGAQGEMQVMPYTAKDPGFGVAPAKDGSPEELARVGGDYLAAMQKRYGDDEKAMAAYNAGPGAVDNAVAKAGDKWLSVMPDETQKYIGKARHLLGQRAADAGAADPAVVDAARVRVTNDALYRSMPDHPEAHAEVMRATDEIAAGNVIQTTRVPDTALPQFREWFGESRAVDESGEPQVAYHGTRADFDSFSPASFGDAMSGEAREAFFFSSSPREASDYASGSAPGGKVIPAYLSLKQPLEVPHEIHGIHDVIEADSKVAAYISQARAQGADGLILRNIAGERGANLFAAFKPEQIKSATGNSGKFDPNSPSLTDPLKPGEPNPRAVNSLPPSERVTIDPETAPQKAEPVQSKESQIVERLAEEHPNMLVKLPGSDETLTLREALQKNFEEAQRDRKQSDLIKAALDCVLGG